MREWHDWSQTSWGSPQKVLQTLICVHISFGNTIATYTLDCHLVLIHVLNAAHRPPRAAFSIFAVCHRPESAPIVTNSPQMCCGLFLNFFRICFELFFNFFRIYLIFLKKGLSGGLPVLRLEARSLDCSGPHRHQAAYCIGSDRSRTLPHTMSFGGDPGPQADPSTRRRWSPTGQYTRMRRASVTKTLAVRARNPEHRGGCSAPKKACARATPPRDEPFQQKNPNMAF